MGGAYKQTYLESLENRKGTPRQPPSNPEGTPRQPPGNPCGKTYSVRQMLKHNRIVYEEQKSIRISWYYNQRQECYEELKKSLGKSIRFGRGVPELSENLSEINPQYNNIIILDDTI